MEFVMKVFSAILLCVFFSLNFAKAQDDTLWPPDPTEIFSENINVEGITHKPTEQPEIYRPIADNERRILRVFNEETDSWQEFSYPDEFMQILWWSPWMWNDHLLIAVPTSESTEYQFHWIMWMLNVDTAEFEVFEPCPDTIVHDAFIDNLQWVFATDIETNQVYLCHYLTGTRHGPLPDTTTFWSSLLVSPDERYFLLRGLDAKSADRLGPYNFHGYEIATENLHYLGSIGSTGIESRYEDWLNNEQILYLHQWGPRNAYYYVIDVSHPDSIISVIEGSYFDRRDKPPRLEYLTTHGSFSRQAELKEHIPCSLHVFDLETIQTHHQILGYNCGGIYSPDGYQYFYVVFQPDPSEMSSLKMLDISSSKVIQLYEDEIEALESVSPDGRYVAVITDDNGVIDRNTMEDVQFFSWSQTNNPMVSFVDVSRGKIVYELPFYRWSRNLDTIYENVVHETYSLNGIPLVGVVWLDDRRCLVQQLSDATQEWNHVLLEFTETGVNKTSIGGFVERIIPDSDSRYLILRQQGESNTVIYSLYDVETHKSRLLFTNPYADDYGYNLEVREEMESIQIDLTIYQRVLVTNNEWTKYTLTVKP